MQVPGLGLGEVGRKEEDSAGVVVPGKAAWAACVTSTGLTQATSEPGPRTPGLGGALQLACGLTVDWNGASEFAPAARTSSIPSAQAASR